jgi:hypothetical protein
VASTCYQILGKAMSGKGFACGGRGGGGGQEK